MSILRVQRAVTALRDFGPYVLLEILLPGGTLVALLLWLSQRYMGEGLGGVRQHLFQQKVAKPAAAAVARFGGSTLCGLLRRLVARRPTTLAPCACCLRPAVTQ